VGSLSAKNASEKFSRLGTFKVNLKAKMYIYVNSTRDLVAKFAAGVVDTGGKLLPGSLIPVASLDLQISPRIFEKI
jgi:hypothetical protein